MSEKILSMAPRAQNCTVNTCSMHRNIVKIGKNLVVRMKCQAPLDFQAVGVRGTRCDSFVAISNYITSRDQASNHHAPGSPI